MVDTTPELFDSHIAVNLKSPFSTMADTIRHLRERLGPTGHGRFGLTNRIRCKRDDLSAE